MLFCPFDGFQLSFREFFDEGRFMVLDCAGCGRAQILSYDKQMAMSTSQQRIFLRNRLYEYYARLKDGAKQKMKMEAVLCKK